MTDHRSHLIERDVRVQAFEREKQIIGAFKTSSEAVASLPFAHTLGEQMPRAS
jgi:hypothetical protein